jgi:hypothetical protein
LCRQDSVSCCLLLLLSPLLLCSTIQCRGKGWDRPQMEAILSPSVIINNCLNNRCSFVRLCCSFDSEAKVGAGANWKQCQWLSLSLQPTDEAQLPT